jgi:hypothetical protein
MYWGFWTGRFLQTASGVGALLTCVDWYRLGAADIRVGRIVVWSLAAGAVAATVATRRLQRSGCPR